MLRVRPLALAALLVLAHAVTARADATAFIGATTAPANRPVKGFSVGFGFLVVGFEFEYANTSSDTASASPALTTGMGNMLLQTPVPLFGFQPYLTAGGGVYREELAAVQNTNVGTNVGGGVKISLIGPVRLRLDYRAFNLYGGALYSPTHRVYAGLNLSF